MVPGPARGTHGSAGPAVLEELEPEVGLRAVADTVVMRV
jgi:hypothetical protein